MPPGWPAAPCSRRTTRGTARRLAPRRVELRRDRREHRRGYRPSPRLRLRQVGRRSDRDPVRRRRRDDDQEVGEAEVPVRRRERPRPVSDPEEGPRRARQRPPRADPRLEHLQALRAVRAEGQEGGSGAIWDLRSNALRPDGWTSADAAGLPILPGLARYDEVAAGSIDHALRFTVQRSRKAYVYPATHYASSLTDPSLPPMGLRLRLQGELRHEQLPAAGARRARRR